MSELAASVNEGGGWTGHRYAAESWDQFDALPIGVKRIFWDAPYEYTALPAYQAWTQGLDLLPIVRRQLAAQARDVAREVRRIYGRDHPDAETGAWL